MPCSLSQVCNLTFKPIPDDLIFPSAKGETLNKFKAIGDGALKDGKVAVLILAGGQASRLGSSCPKGAYPLGPNGLTLFKLHLKNYLLQGAKTVDRVKKPLLLVMTSDATYSETKKCFDQLDQSRVVDLIIFNQGMLPAKLVSDPSKAILKAPGQLFLAPNGNGGLYEAMVSSGALAKMRQRGVEWLHVMSVDNVLAKPADPVFIGLAIDQDADLAHKIVSKRAPSEPAGVFCQALADKSPSFITVAEYSEYGNTSQSFDSTANIANHVFRIAFLDKLCTEILPKNPLPLHDAVKDIKEVLDPITGHPGTTVKGIKQEMFIFDAFKYAKRQVFLKVARDKEFAPLKNGSGSKEDNLETCLEALTRNHLIG